MTAVPPTLPPVTLGRNAPRAHGRLAAALGRLMIRLGGWSIRGEIPDLPRLVIAVAPHTSNWDFLTGLWTKLALQMGAHFVAKHTLFRWPFGAILRRIGGVPVDRSAASGFVGSVARAMREAERMYLVVAPEGTRKRTERWKSGFYRIAQDAGVPILLARFDYPRKTVVFGPLFEPSGDYERDLALMRAHVRPEMALRPANYA